MFGERTKCTRTYMLIIKGKKKWERKGKGDLVSCPEKNYAVEGAGGGGTSCKGGSCCCSDLGCSGWAAEEAEAG